ncbi:hypothetical protein [Nostoc punctiforme]|uniref:Uncharacterized protein n=2 Tax=Nostoc punctiforme TaxID=272131 RepID=B2ITB6_NOSP7|nr:hypothetical protein [Nostoc punctiforme]ACC81147.1 hypothetical protein Npun_F2593 [Nostoc punctiforme PCC 73102]RCJ29198.1 hypothetical protein A6769_35985 [Nostoc punctiforme NIES-2108]
MAEEGVWVVSWTTPEFEPIVRVSKNDQEVSLSSFAATQHAIAIFNAAAYAESEVALFKALVPNVPKGFGKPSKDVQMALMMLKMLRDKREPLPSNISGIFGFNTQKPLVEIDYGKFKLQYELDEVRFHAASLLEAAEAARFDAFWFKFGNQELGLEELEILGIVQKYRLYKQKYSIEAMFKKS